MIIDSITNIMTNFFADMTGPLIIAVGGPGGTGKSWVSKQLAESLGNASVLTLDDYKTPRVERAKKKIFGPHPEANEMQLIIEHLSLLRQGASVNRPVYNSETGCADRVERFHPDHFVILDGEVSTYHEFREYVDFSIFIDAHLTTQLATRLTRDIDDRGYSDKKAMATFFGSNVREFLTFGAESKAWADIVLFADDEYYLSVAHVSDRIKKRMVSPVSEIVLDP